MSRSLADRSRALLECTENVMRAVEENVSDMEFEDAIERQLEVFSDFSRICELDEKLDPSSRDSIDEVLRVEAQIVLQIQTRCESLQKEQRRLSGRSSVAKYFGPEPREGPRFVACRV